MMERNKVIKQGIDENNSLEMDMVMVEVITNNGRIEAKEKTIETSILGDSDITTLTELFEKALNRRGSSEQKEMGRDKKKWQEWEKKILEGTK